MDKRRALGSKCWEKETVKLYEMVKSGDYKINQMRFMIQKFMLSFNKFGLQFDEEALNDRYKSLFLRCGKSPEDMRKLLEQEQEEQQTPDQDVRMAPAAASDLQN